MTLEQQLARIAQEHDLTSLSIVLYRGGNGSCSIGAYAQGGGLGGSCNSSRPTAHEAVSASLADLRAKRFPPSVDVEPFATMADQDGDSA